jgi:hypothetical protein
MDKSSQETRRTLLKASAAAPLVATLHPSNAMAMTSAAYACIADNGAADAITINDIPVMSRVERAPTDLPETLIYYNEGSLQQDGRYYEASDDGETWSEWTGNISGPLRADPEDITTGPQPASTLGFRGKSGKTDDSVSDTSDDDADTSIDQQDDDDTEYGDYYRQTGVTSAIAGYDLTAPEGPKLLGPQPRDGGDAVSNSCLSSLVDAMAFNDGY